MPKRVPRRYSSKPTTTGFWAPRFPSMATIWLSVGRDMAAKLIEVATQRFIDNITSITPGALKGGIQSVVAHPLRDEIVFGGSDGTPRIYRMQRTTARQIGDDANLLWELPSLAGSRVQRRYHARCPRHRRRQQPRWSRPRACLPDGSGAAKVPDPIQAILNKPDTDIDRPRRRTSLHKYFEQGVKTLAQLEVAEGGVYAVALSPEWRPSSRGGRRRNGADCTT